ncbi:teichoic acid D-Ala incorporation-associated protein DltX [Bacillus altitudinis]|nr:teichoic acid D-Ala incorporation-associated protein DltX [Bacillus altitudinis]UTX10845.1 teichoic acid D-Ala incorporation-associated protein DltX [Bacillus altitudinis]
MNMLFKKLPENKSVKWIGYTSFYLLILLLLFFIYGFHTANTGSFIYNDF